MNRIFAPQVFLLLRKLCYVNIIGQTLYHWSSSHAWMVCSYPLLHSQRFDNVLSNYYVKEQDCLVFTINITSPISIISLMLLYNWHLGGTVEAEKNLGLKTRKHFELTTAKFKPQPLYTLHCSMIVDCVYTLHFQTTKTF